MLTIWLILAYAAALGRMAAPYPFAVGETLRYEAKLGYFSIGTASISVAQLAAQGKGKAFVFRMSGQGGPPGWRVRYDLTSWVDSTQFNSLRFHRRLEQAGKVEEERYIIVPDSGRYRLEGREGDWVAPPKPLDELAFLYFLRTVPLQNGRSYNFDRYFRNGYNPVQVDVTGRESITLSSGAVRCLAVRVTARGMVMRVWLTDDARRLPAQLEVPLQFGVVSLQLTEGEAAGKAAE